MKTPQRNFRRENQNNQNFRVAQEAQLMVFLQSTLTQQTRNTIKSYLSHRQILVNDKVATAYDYCLHKGDIVTLLKIGRRKENPNHRVKIIYEDDDILIIDKKNGVLTAPTGKSNEETAYSVMTEHVRRHDRNNKIYVVHRLERDMSGLVIFAKNEEMQNRLQCDWRDNIISRSYIGVAEGKLNEQKGQIISWLSENDSTMKMQSSAVDNGSKKAITNFKVLKENALYSLVQFTLETEYKNQIRVQMASICNAIAGDKRYGAISNPLGRLCLHARTISLIHPITREPLKFDTGIPTIFT